VKVGDLVKTRMGDIGIILRQAESRHSAKQWIVLFDDDTQIRFMASALEAISENR
jgi:hypothetical protein